MHVHVSGSWHWRPRSICVWSPGRCWCPGWRSRGPGHPPRGQSLHGTRDSPCWLNPMMAGYCAGSRRHPEEFYDDFKSFVWRNRINNLITLIPWLAARTGKRNVTICTALFIGVNVFHLIFVSSVFSFINIIGQALPALPWSRKHPAMPQFGRGIWLMPVSLSLLFSWM